MRRTGGFTLIELVAVIVILGVLGIATTKFIVFGTELYIQATDRQHVLSKSRFLVERLSRELKSSIPNSVRIRNDSISSCMSYVPIKGSGAYRTDSSATPPPIAPNSGTQIDVVSWQGNYDANDLLYIYAANVNDIYRNNTQFAVIDAISGTSPNFQFSLNFTNSDDYFTLGSPQQRYYTASGSVIWCLYRGNMYRFESSSISPIMPRVFTVVGRGVLMSEGLANTISSEPPFTYRSGALYRNSVVNLYFEFNANLDENMFFNQEVHIANVP